MSQKHNFMLVFLTIMLTCVTLLAIKVVIDNDTGKLTALMGFSALPRAVEEGVAGIWDLTAGDEPSETAGEAKDKETKVKALTAKEVLLDAPAVSQMPELYNGCEVTSLSMLFQYNGIQLDKLELADRIVKDPAPVVKNANGVVVSWGNPQKGFVGDIRGYRMGFGVYHKPILKLVEDIKPGRGVNLTGKPFDELLLQVEQGRPVLVWTTTSLKPLADSSWITWKSAEGPVRTTWNEHVVLLVGYDADYFYVNDPMDGAKSKKVARDPFIKTWEQMGKQALTMK